MVQIVIEDSHHHTYGASSAHRWLICRGSVALILQLIKEGKISGFSSSYKAELGTVIHFVIEHVLGKGRKLRYFKNAKFVPANKDSWVSEFITVDSHDLDCARVAIRHVRAIMKKHPKGKFFAEQSFDMSDEYGLDFGGTGDLTLLVPKDVAIIADYKNGGHYVDEIRNPQTRIYGLGAYHKYYEDYKFKHVEMGIIQPNSNSKKGPIRYEKLRLSDLLRWDEKTLRPAIEAIKNKSSSLVPGPSQCQWCPAKNHCPAKNSLTKPAENNSGLLEPLRSDGGAQFPPIESLTKEQLDLVLEHADSLIKYLNEAKAHAKSNLKENPDYLQQWYLQPTKGHRKLIPKNRLRPILRKAGLTYKDLTVTETRELSVTEIEKKFKVRPDIADVMKKITYQDEGGGTLKKRSSAKADFENIRTKRTKRTRRT